MYICKGCFCKKETNGICPRCGYDEKNYIVKKEISKPGTILLNRYLLGNCIKETDEYINYKAYDRVLDEEIIIQQKKQGIPESWYLNKLRWFCYFKDNPHLICLKNYIETNEKKYAIYEYLEGKALLEEKDISGQYITINTKDILEIKNQYKILDIDVDLQHEKERMNEFKENTCKETLFLREGSCLNRRYCIEKCIGQGGFGIVYLAYDEVLSRKVAIKEYMPMEWVERDAEDSSVQILSSAYVDDFKNGLKKFVNEAIYMAKLQKTSAVVNVYDIFFENETAYIVMEYVQGENIGNVRKVMEDFSYETARNIFITLLKIIRDIHEIGLIHGDISPGNIILDQFNQLRVIDFGSSHPIGTKPKSIGEMLIKAGYAAVEQYDEELPEREYTDIYQAAATFYYLITGEKPVESTKRLEKDILTKLFEVNIDIPEKDEKILMRALAVLPEERFRKIDEILEMYEINVNSVD